MLNLLPPDAATETDLRHTVYQIHIELPWGCATYTGRTSGDLQQHGQDYRRDAGRLLNGVPRPDGHHYRTIHHALAAAVLQGWPTTIRVAATAADAAEARALEERNLSRIGGEASLNGTRDSDGRKAFRQLVAAHLRHLGLAPEAIQRMLGKPLRDTPLGDTRVSDVAEPLPASVNLDLCRQKTRRPAARAKSPQAETPARALRRDWHPAH